MSRTFSTKKGSVESWKCFCRWGWRWNAVQTRWTVDFDTPVASAMARQVQCVRPSGGRVSSVFRSSVMRVSSGRLRGLPGRCSSYRPMRPWVRKRARHRPTVWRLTRTRSATVVLSRPWAHSSTIRARPTRPAGRLRDRASASSASRVSWLTASGGNGRPRAMVSSPSCGWMGSRIPCLRHYAHIFPGRNTRRTLIFARLRFIPARFASAFTSLLLISQY